MIECEYKQGRAHRHFTNDFVVEAYIKNLKDNSKHCFLKTKCLPSRRVLS